MGKDKLAARIIAKVNEFLQSHPHAAAKHQRYVIPEYDLARHNEMVEHAEQAGLVQPDPEQLANLHLYYRGNEKKPRRRKK